MSASTSSRIELSGLDGSERDLPPLDPAAAPSPLDGGTVLLVEDEALIAFEAEDLLRDLGAAEVTVCSSYSTADKAVDTTEHVYAIFDLNLNGRLSTPLIERFVARGGRAVIATGYELPEGFADALKAIHLIKPYNGRRLAEALNSLADAEA